jgi:hypothetical protein
MKKRWAVFITILIFTMIAISMIDSESIIPTICAIIGVLILALYEKVNRRR